MAEGETNTQRSQQVDAAIAEYLEQAEQGIEADRDAFLAQHAEIADELREFLGDYSIVKQQAPPPPSPPRPASRRTQRHRGNQMPQWSPTASGSPAGRAHGEMSEMPNAAGGAGWNCCGAAAQRPTAAGDSPVTGETLSFRSSEVDSTNSAVAGAICEVKSGPLPEIGHRFGPVRIVRTTRRRRLWRGLSGAQRSVGPRSWR